MIIVKKGYYYLSEVYRHCFKRKSYSHFITILDSLRNADEKYVSSIFFFDKLDNIKKDLTDLKGYVNIKYFCFGNKMQEKKAMEYFDYKIPKNCKNLKDIHLYNEKINYCIKRGYTVNFLGMYNTTDKLKEKRISLLDYNKIIVLENKNKNNKKKMFFGVWK